MFQLANAISETKSSIANRPSSRSTTTVVTASAFLWVVSAAAIVGLEQVAAGRAEQEGVEKMGDQRNAGGAAKRQVQPLHRQHQTPADDADENRRAHENKRGQQPYNAYAGDGLPQADRPDRPACTNLFGECQAGPVFGLLLGFTGENAVQNPRYQDKADGQFQREAQGVGSGFQSSPQMDFRWATPSLAASGLRLGLSSKTLMCSGFTRCLSPS